MQLVWKRPEQIFERFKLFEGIDPTDIRQGIIGDCYFLAALSALAENPERIKRLFKSQEV